MTTFIMCEPICRSRQNDQGSYFVWVNWISDVKVMKFGGDRQKEKEKQSSLVLEGNYVSTLSPVQLYFYPPFSTL
jgi:hypothetical protein